MDNRASRSGVGDVEFRRNLFGGREPGTSGGTKYEKLKYDEEENEAFLSDTLKQQQQVMEMQDETLDKIGSSVGVLKDMSQKIGTEINDHLVIMEDLGNHMEQTDTTMSRVMRKLNKVSRMADDKHQWVAIIVLLVVLVVVLILFFVI